VLPGARRPGAVPGQASCGWGCARPPVFVFRPRRDRGARWSKVFPAEAGEPRAALLRWSPRLRREEDEGESVLWTGSVEEARRAQRAKGLPRLPAWLGLPGSRGPGGNGPSSGCRAKMVSRDPHLPPQAKRKELSPSLRVRSSFPAPGTRWQTAKKNPRADSHSRTGVAQLRDRQSTGCSTALGGILSPGCRVVPLPRALQFFDFS